MPERKAFNFYNSYFQVYKELSNTDKIKFIDALLNKQFHDIEPKLTGMAKFAYLSQKHSIDAQVIGYKSKVKSGLPTPSEGGSVGGSEGGSVQEKGEEKVEEKLESRIYKAFDHLSITIEEVEKLKESGYSQNQIDDMLLNIENYKNNKNYKSLYLTCLKWLKKETPQNNTSKLYTFDCFFTRYKNKSKEEYEFQLKRCGKENVTLISIT